MRRKQGRDQFQKAQCRGGETGRRGGLKELGAILKRRDPQNQKEARSSSGAITRYFEEGQFSQPPPVGGMGLDSRLPSGEWCDTWSKTAFGV